MSSVNNFQAPPSQSSEILGKWASTSSINVFAATHPHTCIQLAGSCLMNWVVKSNNQICVVYVADVHIGLFRFMSVENLLTVR